MLNGRGDGLAGWMDGWKYIWVNETKKILHSEFIPLQMNLVLPSLNTFPCASVFFTDSDPARSTNFNFLDIFTSRLKK